jgi:hypothetical protein
VETYGDKRFLIEEGKKLTFKETDVVVFNHHLTGAELERQMEISDLGLLIFSPVLYRTAFGI